MINTYKESSLHRTLKELYAAKTGGKTEVEADGHIYDILTDKGEVIEMQTQNLAKLKKKILDSLEKGRKVKVVHPVIIEKIIRTKDENGNILSVRKSPKKGSVYSIFDEIKGIFNILLLKNFTLEILEINMTEERIKSDQLLQSENRRRRFKKNWNKTNKYLEKILCVHTFKTARDYLNLLPATLNEEFTVNDIKEGLKNEKPHIKKAPEYSNLIAWTFLKMGLFELTGKKGNAKVYRIIIKRR